MSFNTRRHKRGLWQWNIDGPRCSNDDVIGNPCDMQTDPTDILAVWML